MGEKGEQVINLSESEIDDDLGIEDDIRPNFGDQIDQNQMQGMKNVNNNNKVF